MMNKKQQTNINDVSMLNKKRKRKIILPLFLGSLTVAIAVGIGVPVANSVALEKKILENSKQNLEIAKKIANSNLENKNAKIQTFTSINTNEISTSNLDNSFNIAYNREINLAKTDLAKFMQKYNIKNSENLNINEIKKKIESLKYKEISFIEQHNKTTYSNSTNLKNTNLKVAKILDNLTFSLNDTSKKLTDLTIALGVTSAGITAGLTVAGFFTLGIAALPLIPILAAFAAVTAIIAGVVGNLNSMIQLIQTNNSSMIGLNSAFTIANLPLELNKQINKLHLQLSEIRPYWAIVGIHKAIEEMENAIVQMEKLKNSKDLADAIKEILLEKSKKSNSTSNEKQKPTKIVYINQSERLRTVSVGATTGHQDEKLTYQWYSNTTNSTVNGKPISGATSASYKITPADVGASPTTKYFYVIISGSINGAPLVPVTSKTTSLIVNALPVINISNQATAQNVSVNQKINLPTFSVVAATSTDNENAKLTYQWFLVAENHQPTKITGATNASYQVTAEDTKNIGLKYFYAVVNGTINGVQLTPITSGVNSLMVDNQPENLKTTLNKIVYLNQTQDLPTFSVKASVSGNWDVKFSYQWYENNINSTIGGTAIEGATSSSYSIQESDVGLSPTKKYFYVIVGGTINGVELVPVTSQAYSLTTKTIPIINKNTGLILQN